MPTTFDPTAVLNFLFVDPIQWWYYAVGLGIIVAGKVVLSNTGKRVEPNVEAQSPLQTAQEYGGQESEPEASVDAERDAVLEGLVRKPKLQPSGNGNAIDQATEYMIASAMINSAPYVRFKNIKIPTKFGELVFDNEEPPQTVERPRQETPAQPVPQIPQEDKVEE